MSLTEFYKSYAEWLSKGAPQNMPYWRESGLCLALKVFCWKLGMTVTERHRLCDEQNKLFTDAGLNDSFPFHNGEMTDYHYECTRHECYKNVQRVNWVHAHAN